MPFAMAATLFYIITKIELSNQTSQRHTKKMGQAVLGSQNEQLKEIMESLPKGPSQNKPLVLSVDGAMISLVKKTWVEVRTLVVGTVSEGKKGDPAKQEVKTVELSKFSRLSDAETFTYEATLETHRRGVDQAPRVAFVTDGAEWINTFIDTQANEAVRILDFVHASEYVSKIGRIVIAAELFPGWLNQRLHQLKEEGADKLLLELNDLVGAAQPNGELSTALNYLQKRQDRMQYHIYRQQGWPIGSGMVESANKTVVQARLKGAGMHWERTSVNPMLALRNLIVNDRWEEGCQQRVAYHYAQIDQRFEKRAKSNELKKGISPESADTLTQAAPAVAVLEKPAEPLRVKPKLVVNGRPTQAHPWRNRVVALTIKPNLN